MCEYCKDYNQKCLSERNDKMSRKGDFYSGIQTYIEENKLQINAVADVYEPNFTEKSIKINYCPMCGRRLEDK